ncbi:hypothetical protein [Psychrobacter sp.]|uniref:hypothetical protein n=1 Tax=Psychrobacter sp. TaxID=56811 RepID=UPI003C773A54
MNKCIALAAILVASTNFTGCSVWDIKYGEGKPKITHQLHDVNGEERDGIYAWNPDTVGAVTSRTYPTDKDGKLIYVLKGEKTVPLSIPRTCVMSAAAIKAKDSEGGVTVNVNPPVGSTGVNFNAMSRELQKITVLSTKSEAATFLDVALFGICMSTMNGQLQESENRALFEIAIKESAAIAIAAEGTKREAIKPDPIQPIQPIPSIVQIPSIIQRVPAAPD